MKAQSYTRPENVPERLVVDFDFFDPPNWDEDLQLAWKVLQRGPDIIWTPHNGGHWIATRAEDIDAIQLDYEHFSHNQFNLPPNPKDIDLIPLALDPPDHGKFRKLLTPAMMPKAIKLLEENARATARALIDDIAPRGECDFIKDFAKIVPINVFFSMVGLPLKDREMLMEWAEVGPRSDDLEEKKAASRKIGNYLKAFVMARTASPGNDLISHITQSEIDGRRISSGDALNLCILLLFGGLDTVASQMGFIAKFLAESPEHRRLLRERPQIMSNAVEEMIRRFSLVNTARLLSQDYEYKGIQFRKGDMIQIPKALYGLDDRKNADPDTVDFDRKRSTIKHVAFGAGPHTCPGGVLARRELMVFLEEWLPRIPDFEIDPAKPTKILSGVTSSVVELHLRWTPAEMPASRSGS
jgi:cytochrome P450